MPKLSIRRGAIALLFPLTLVVPAVADTTKDYCAWKVASHAISEPLCGLKGNPANGRKLAINRKKGNCLACHKMPIPKEDFHGTIAPPLMGVASRYNDAQIRLRLSRQKAVVN